MLLTDQLYRQVGGGSWVGNVVEKLRLKLTSAKIEVDFVFLKEDILRFISKTVFF